MFSPILASRTHGALRRTRLVAVVAALSACAAPDRHEAPAPPLPDDALARLAPDSLRSSRVSDGVFYLYAWSARGPWAVHLVSADLRRCELDLLAVPALGEDGVTRVRMPVTEMLPFGAATALIGVNGDFFSPDGTPTGPEVTSTTMRFSGRPAIAWGGGPVPWIGTPVRDSDGMRFGPNAISGDSSGSSAAGPSTADSSLPRHGLQVLGGFPELLDGGVVVGDLGVAERPGFAAARHPRTAVGLDTRNGLLWLVVVDGRQAPRSAGMSLPELADLFLSLGVDEAINLDGGGSSAMSLGGRLVSSPSDAAGERPVGNSLWVVRDETACGGPR